MRVLITGSRDHPDSFIEVIHRDLFDLNQECLAKGERLTIIHGNNPKGADHMATLIAEELGANLYRYPAEWDHYREMGLVKAAGNIRNEEMIRETAPDIVYAYPLPQSKGTYNCIDLAHAYSIPVVVR